MILVFPGAEKLGKMVQMLQESSSAMLGQLVGLEAEVQHISQELRAEKLLWSSRYLELLREQQELLVQVGLERKPPFLQESLPQGSSSAGKMVGQGWRAHLYPAPKAVRTCSSCHSPWLFWG